MSGEGGEGGVRDADRASGASEERATSRDAMRAHEDPRAELALLARALEHAIARRARLGARRAAAPKATASSPIASAPITSAPAPRAPAAPTPRATPPILDMPPRVAAHARAESAADASRAQSPRTAASAPPASAPTSTPLPSALAPTAPDLDTLRAHVAACRACDLCRTRTQTVFSDGNGSSGVLFVGEAPGEQEDRRGLPFVGPAGQLLTDIVQKGMGLAREDVYIANVLKCRPPQNRDPSGPEKELCTPWLDRQIELVRPKIVIALGRHAAGHLLRTESSLSRLRGRIHERAGHKVLATFHPAYLLRNPADKKECWKDIQIAMRELGLTPPGSRA